MHTSQVTRPEEGAGAIFWMFWSAMFAGGLVLGGGGVYLLRTTHLWMWALVALVGGVLVALAFWLVYQMATRPMQDQGE